MKKLYLISGPAGIGKSTWCRHYKESHHDELVIVISADEVRKKMCGSYLNFPPHKDMTPIYEEMIKEGTEAYQKNQDLTLMIDTTMLFDERRLFFINRLPPFDETTLVMMKVHDYQICLDRNKHRANEKWVPEAVIEDMVKGYEEPGSEVISKVTRVLEVYNDND